MQLPLGGAIGEGWVFASGTGSLAGSSERLKESQGAVIVRVEADGRYTVRVGRDGTCEEHAFDGP